MSTYHEAVEFIAEYAPSLDKPGDVIKWAEDICALLGHIYPHRDYDTITENLYEAIKLYQD